ncbi:DUF2617 family protein [Botrimarina sp.]|uniref:DUF2617 family protein n=1 Tax=Botrimarina sp. TaxID=2795802 RepID=UPI0032EFC5BD
MLSVRPKIAELVLQLYGRSLHPELFEVFGSKRVQRGRVAPAPGSADDEAALAASDAGGYEALVQITGAGHVVTWRHGGLTLTEVAASSHQPMPQKRRLMSHRLEGEQADQIECRGGVIYETNFSLETVTPEAFAIYQREFDLITLQDSAGPAAPGLSNGLLHRFDASGRAGVSLGAVSFVDVQSRDRSLRVRAMHTFPDDYAIVKTESVFRLPS